MDDRARRFQATVLRHLRGKTGRGVRYPEELHQEAVSYAKARRQRGDSILAICRDLGVNPVTLTRWLRRADDPEFRRVEIVTSGQPVMGSAVGVTVTTPSGIRIEGLDLESLIALLQRLA
jgi:hypothetical protein